MHYYGFKSEEPQHVVSGEHLDLLIGTYGEDSNRTFQRAQAIANQIDGKEQNAHRKRPEVI